MRIVAYTLADDPFAGRTGKGVRVAVVDSGVSAGHPHVGDVAESVCVGAAAQASDKRDRLGHGTAVAAAIREKAPGVALLSVKVFDRALTTTAETLAEAIILAADLDAVLINLSLGTSNPGRADVLRAAIAHAASRRAVVVSALETAGTPWLPGSLSGVAGTLVDWECDRDALEVRYDAAGAPTFRASAYPRPIPGVPRERNLSGISFAVANATGFLARLLEGNPEARTLREIGRLLDRRDEERER